MIPCRVRQRLLKHHAEIALFWACSEKRQCKVLFA
jgi:hypothetical protein